MNLIKKLEETYCSEKKQQEEVIVEEERKELKFKVSKVLNNIYLGIKNWVKNI